MKSRAVRSSIIVAVVAVVSGWCGGGVAVFAQDPATGGEEHASPSSSESPASPPADQQEQPSEPQAAQPTSEGATQEEGTTASTEPPVAPTLPPMAPSESGLISVDFKDADIRQVLRILSLKSGVDIVAGPDVEGLVTIKLTNVPWEQALDIIMRTYGFAYERKGNVVRVLTLAAVEQEALSTEVFPLNYAKAKEVSEVLKEMLSDRGKIKFDERTNTVIVTDLPSTLFQLGQVVERLDQATPQVYIESKIIETKLKDEENIGIDWFSSVASTITPAQIPTTFPFSGGGSFGNLGETFIPYPGTFSPSSGAVLTQGKVPEFGGQFTFGTINPATSLSMTLNMLKQRTDTKVISNPTIVTLNNKEAFVQVGEDINIPNFQIDSSTGKATVTGVNARSTGVIMKVTPHVNASKEIVLDLKPEITSANQTFDDFGNNIKFPRFTVQKADTQVRLLDGQTLVIGGLVKRQTVVVKDKVPILGDLPLFGLLFSNRSETVDPHQDLLIFLTVKLVEEEADTYPTTMAAQASVD